MGPGAGLKCTDCELLTRMHEIMFKSCLMYDKREMNHKLCKDISSGVIILLNGGIKCDVYSFKI